MVTIYQPMACGWPAVVAREELAVFKAMLNLLITLYSYIIFSITFSFFSTTLLILFYEKNMDVFIM